MGDDLQVLAGNMVLALVGRISYSHSIYLYHYGFNHRKSYLEGDKERSGEMDKMKGERNKGLSFTWR